MRPIWRSSRRFCRLLEPRSCGAPPCTAILWGIRLSTRSWEPGTRAIRHFSTCRAPLARKRITDCVDSRWSTPVFTDVQASCHRSLRASLLRTGTERGFRQPAAAGVGALREDRRGGGRERPPEVTCRIARWPVALGQRAASYWVAWAEGPPKVRCPRCQCRGTVTPSRQRAEKYGLRGCLSRIRSALRCRRRAVDRHPAGP